MRDTRAETQGRVSISMSSCSSGSLVEFEVFVAALNLELNGDECWELDASGSLVEAEVLVAVLNFGLNGDECWELDAGGSLVEFEVLVAVLNLELNGDKCWGLDASFTGSLEAMQSVRPY